MYIREVIKYNVMHQHHFACIWLNFKMHAYMSVFNPTRFFLIIIYLKTPSECTSPGLKCLHSRYYFNLIRLFFKKCVSDVFKPRGRI